MAATKDAQKKLRQKWDPFIEGRAPEPSQEETAAVHRLQQIEDHKLKAAIQSMHEAGSTRHS